MILRRWLVLFIIGLVLVTKGSSSQDEIRDYRNQIIRNTELLRNLEYRIGALERGGSTVSIETAQRAAVLESNLASTNRELDNLQHIVYWMIGIGVAVNGGLLSMLIKFFLDKSILQNRLQDIARTIQRSDE